MAFSSYYKLSESEFDNIVSKIDKLQNSNITQLKLEVHDTYKKDEKEEQTLNLLITKTYKQSLLRR